MKKLLLSIDDEMYKKLDENAKNTKMTKSQYIRTAIFIKLLNDAAKEHTIK